MTAARPGRWKALLNALRLTDETPRRRLRFALVDALEPRICLSAGATISFLPIQRYENGAAQAASGDFNHDGHTDIVDVSAPREVVHVYLNRGDGTFGAPESFFVGNPRWVTVADFNGDGNLDFAVANPTNNLQKGNGIDLFYGRGDGTFFGPVRYGTVNPAVTVAAADVNGDGLPDLVIGNRQRVSVKLNLGQQQFAPPIFYLSGPGITRSVSVADFNHDGALDLAVARTENVVVVLTGQKDANGHPTGAFAPPVSYAAGISTNFALVGDFNNDGNPDIAVANSDFRVNPVGVLLGNGDGTFQPRRNYFGGNFVEGLTAADFNGDGNLDLATTSFTSAMRVYAGNGDGTFRPHNDFEGGKSGVFMTAADLNGDGLPDAIVCSGGAMKILINNTVVTPPNPGTPGALDVPLGGGAPSALRFVNAHGFATTLSLSGPGSAAVQFTGADLAQTGNTITGQNLSIGAITLAGTTTASNLSFTTGGKSGVVDVGSITDPGSLGSLSGAPVLLRGNVSIGGIIRNVTLDTATDCTMTIGAGGPRDTLSLNVTRADGFAVQSAMPVQAVNVGQWISSDGTPSGLTAPSVASIRSDNVFSADLTIGAGGVGSFDSRGITGGTWNIAGPLGRINLRGNATFTVNAASIGTISGSGSLIGSTVHSAGNINSVSVVAMLSSAIYAGVGPLPPGQLLPTSAADFTGVATIGSIAVRQGNRGVTFINSAIAASSISRANLGTIQMPNNGVPFGLAAHQIGSVAGKDAQTHKTFNLTTPTDSASASAALQARGISPADFTVRII